MNKHTIWIKAQFLTVALLLVFAFTAQAQLPGFSEVRGLSGLSGDSYSIAAGDVNRDGAPDVVTSSSAGDLSLSLNDGSGNFPGAVLFGTEGVPAHTLKLVNLDGDGDLDLIGATADGLFVYLYDSTSAEFSSRATIGPTGLVISAIDVADVNNDSKPDIIVGVSGGQSAVFLNNGSGGFFYGSVVCGTNPSQYRCFGAATGVVGTLQAGDMNGDNKMDIVVGRGVYTQSSYIFFNDGVGNFSTGGTLPSPTFNIIHSLGLGDLNGDGLLDVVSGETGSTTGSLSVYLNLGSGTFAAPTQVGETTGISLLGHPGLLDIDLDGDLDIAYSLADKHVIFLNNGAGAFYSGAVSCDAPPANAYCFARGADYIKDLAVIDLDNDGDLDLAAIHSNNTDLLYMNDGYTTLPAPADGSGTVVVDNTALPTSLALGDLNGDGLLDVVAGTGNGAALLINQGNGTLAVSQELPSGLNYQDINLGDLDGDNRLDILASLANNYLVILFNNGSGGFPSGELDCGNEYAACLGGASDANINAAIGDLDGDGDLDILANRNTGERTLYINDGAGGFGTHVPFAFPAVGTGGDVALADVDIDGDLDAILVQAVALPGYVYINDGAGGFNTGLVNCANPPASVHCFDTGKGTSLATADLNSDGFLDILVGKDSGQSRLYLNDGLGNFSGSTATRSFGGMETAFGIAAFDADGDGDLDIAAANGPSQVDTLYLNDGAGTFGPLAPARQFGSSSDAIYRVSGGDMNSDGMADLVLLSYDNAASRSRVSITPNYTRKTRALPDNLPYLTLSRPGSTPQADGYAVATIIESNTVTFNYKLYDQQSQPVSRIEVYFSPDGGGKWYPAKPAVGTVTQNLSTTPGGTQHTYTWDTAASGFFGKSDRVVLRMLAYSTTYPQRWSYASASTYPFRMRGMQVRVTEGGNPVQGALVLRRAGSSGNYEYIRDGAGNPQVTNLDGYLEGRGALESGDGLIALLPISATNTYTFYHTNAVPTEQGATGLTISTFGVQTINVSAGHPLMLLNFTISLQWDASNDPSYKDRLTYDLQTVSQRLYDWSNGQIALGKLTVHQNRDLWNDALIRIYANNRFRPTAMKGGIVTSITTDPDVPAITYAPGQIHMGAVWNRYGTAGSNLEQDWPRALAHEMSHYALFLDDNYLGLDDVGQVIPVDSCPSVMSDPYRKDYPYDEYHPADAWDAECGDTLSNRLTGRSDWETISTFYPFISFTGINTGPNGQPMNVTEVEILDPVGESTALADPTFYLTQNGGRVEPGRQARAFLFQDNWAVDLGKPTIDHILARGARPGDRVCVYEPEAGQMGCETVTIGDEQIELNLVPDWMPQITVNPVSSTTITVNVEGLSSGQAVYARLYPVMSTAGAAQAMTYAGKSYTTTFTLAEPAMEGYVVVYINGSNPYREAIVDYAIGGSPANVRGSNSNVRGSNAPASSTDGQVILFTPDTQLDENEFYTLQALTQAPALPGWAGTASRPYRIAASTGAASLAGSSLTFSYMGDEVQSGEEDWLKVYYWNGSSWEALPTNVDTYFNTASAPAEQPGIYILLSSVEVQLFGPGWNLVAYPLQVNLPVAPAVSSLLNLPVLTVYSYNQTATDPWTLYHPGAPDWVNDLTTMKQGQGYWIYTSQDSVWRLSGGMASASGKSESAIESSAPTPPATVYGWVYAKDSFVPAVGTPIQAYVDGTLCASTTVFSTGGKLVYKLELPDNTTCGGEGRTISLRSGSTQFPETGLWTTTAPVNINLFDIKKLFLPIITR